MTSHAFIFHRYDTFWFTVVICITLYLVIALNNLIISIVLIEMDNHWDWLWSTNLLHLHLLLLQLLQAWILHSHLILLHHILRIHINVWPLCWAISNIHVHSISSRFLILRQILIMDGLYLLLELKLNLLMHLLLHHHIAQHLLLLHLRGITSHLHIHGRWIYLIYSVRPIRASRAHSSRAITTWAVTTWARSLPSRGRVWLTAARSCISRTSISRALVGSSSFAWWSVSSAVNKILTCDQLRDVFVPSAVNRVHARIINLWTI